MLDALTQQLSPRSRDLTDRSIAATAGALFGVVLCGTAAIATNRAPFTIDVPMLTLYASAIPLSVAGFMVQFSRKAPRLPILATLWFLALFVPMMFFSEALLSWGEIRIGDLALPAKNFVGFRAVVVAALSGLVFCAIEADGVVSKLTKTVVSKVDWSKRHDEAIRRLAMVDIDLRDQRSSEQSALDAFDRLLGDVPAAEEWVLEEVEEQSRAVQIEVLNVTAA